MQPLEHKSFPLSDNVRRAAYWLTALILLVATYLGARGTLDGVDMAFVTGFTVLITGMAGVNTPTPPGKE